MDILSGTPFLIFAWSTKNPGNDISYHSSNRGSTVAPLISSLNLKVTLNTSQLETIEYRVNVSYIRNFKYFYNFFFYNFSIK